MNEIFDYPIMHLDRVYHTGEKSHISREALVEKVYEFADTHEKWIIDGNYIATLDMRVQLANTIIVLDIPSKTCLENACRRSEESLKVGNQRADMAEGFDYRMTEEFGNFIRNFQTDTLPQIKEILRKYNDKTIRILSSYEEVDQLLNKLKKGKSI